MSWPPRDASQLFDSPPGRSMPPSLPEEDDSPQKQSCFSGIDDRDRSGRGDCLDTSSLARRQLRSREVSEVSPLERTLLPVSPRQERLYLPGQWTS